MTVIICQQNAASKISRSERLPPPSRVLTPMHSPRMY